MPVLFALQTLFSLLMLYDAVKHRRERFWWLIVLVPFGECVYFLAVKWPELRQRQLRGAAQGARAEWVEERATLLAERPGGGPERPLIVSTPAVIEGRAGGQPCPLCEGRVSVDDHAAESHNGESFRVVRGRCQSCHAPIETWFRIERPHAAN